MYCDCLFFNKQNNSCELDIFLTYDYGECEYNSNKIDKNIDIFKEDLQNYIISLHAKILKLENVLDKNNIKELLLSHRKYINKPPENYKRPSLIQGKKD